MLKNCYVFENDSNHIIFYKCIILEITLLLTCIPDCVTQLIIIGPENMRINHYKIHADRIWLWLDEQLLWSFFLLPVLSSRFFHQLLPLSLEVPKPMFGFKGLPKPKSSSNATIRLSTAGAASAATQSTANRRAIATNHLILTTGSFVDRCQLFTTKYLWFM